MTPAHAVCYAVGEEHCVSEGPAAGLSVLDEEAVAHSHVDGILRHMGFESRAHAFAWVSGAAT